MPVARRTRRVEIGWSTLTLKSAFFLLCLAWSGAGAADRTYLIDPQWTASSPRAQSAKVEPLRRSGPTCLAASLGCRREREDGATTIAYVITDNAARVAGELIWSAELVQAAHRLGPDVRRLNASAETSPRSGRHINKGLPDARLAP